MSPGQVVGNEKEVTSFPAKGLADREPGELSVGTVRRNYEVVVDIVRPQVNKWARSLIRLLDRLVTCESSNIPIESDWGPLSTLFQTSMPIDPPA